MVNDQQTAASIGRHNILANKLVGDWQCGWGTRGVIIGLLDKAIGMDGEKMEREQLRRSIFGYLFADSMGVRPGALSSKVLDDSCWYALYVWVQPTKDQETGQWRSDNINFQREVLILADEAHRMQEVWKKREAEILGQLGFDV